MKKISYRQTVVLFVILIALAGVFFIFKDDITKRLGNNDQKVLEKATISYPSGWKELKINDSEKLAGVTLKVGRSNPGASLMIRRIVGKLDPNFNIKTLPDEVVRAFSKEIDNFTLVGKKISRIGDYDVVQIQYKQLNPKDKKTYENLIIIMPTPTQTFYLTFRSEEAEFDKIKKDTTKISEDFAAYLESLKL